MKCLLYFKQSQEYSRCGELQTAVVSIGWYGAPAIVNPDQGSQFTRTAWTGLLDAVGVRISMDGLRVADVQPAYNSRGALPDRQCASICSRVFPLVSGTRR